MTKPIGPIPPGFSSDGDGMLLTTVKWASSSGKPFLGTDRTNSGVVPSVEVKRPEVVEAIDPEDLTGNDDDPVVKPNQNQPDVKRVVAPEAVSPKQQPEDTQLKKALELLRDKPASQRTS